MKHHNSVISRHQSTKPMLPFSIAEQQKTQKLCFNQKMEDTDRAMACRNRELISDPNFDPGAKYNGDLPPSVSVLSNR